MGISCITSSPTRSSKTRGFKLDIHGNAFGFLAAHPIAPFISMHHLDEIGPVIPQYSALDGLHHLTKAMRTEPSTFLQRCICYTPNKRLTFSVSLGYAIQVYPFIVLPRDLERAEITFRAWNKKAGGGEFNFDTRAAVKSVCKRPFLFFLDRIDREGSKVVSIYKRDTTVDSHKRWFFCFFSTSLEKKVQQIRVVSKPLDLHWFKVPRRQCCKVTSVQDEELAIHVNSCQIKERRL
ncbi:hypothetical protein L7F22_026321 [Adiantum nelumboides]|nr:hypothetical protein [Adiantum nelumboides]